MDRPLASALRELLRLFFQAQGDLRISLRFALLGGLAVSTWGVIRATQDIDFMADSDPSPLRDVALREKIKKSFEKQGSSIQWRIGDHDDPIPLLLRIELSSRFHNVGSDILWAHKRWQQEALRRAINVEFDGIALPVLHPEDLILMKFDAGGPQDLLDVEELIALGHPQINLVRLKKSATRLRLGRQLEQCLRKAGRKI